MHKFIIEKRIERILSKLEKKNRNLYHQIKNKIKEIINSEDIEHYKNLKYNMKDSKRVHIGHYVLVFQYNKIKDLIVFDDLDHHDNVYKK